MLYRLSMYKNSYPIFLESNSLGRLFNLRVLYLDSIVFGPDFIWGESRSTEHFTLNNGIAKNISLDYLLDKIKIPSAQSFAIDGLAMGTQFQTLAPSNFTNFDNNELTYLCLMNCGIEIILANTFDSIGSYLENLFLCGNKIKHIYMEQFGTYLVAAESEKWFSLSDNPIDCDCNFYLVKSVWFMNFIRPYSINEEFYCLNHSISNLNEKCPTLQQIRPHKLCFQTNNTNADILVYPKFNLKLERESYRTVIKTVAIANFKLVILRPCTQPSRIKCPSKHWVKTNARCWLLKNETKHFEDEFYRHPGFTFMSVFHLTYSRVWPLHLITIRSQLRSQPMIELLIWISLSGLLIGFVGCFLYQLLVKYVI